MEVLSRRVGELVSSVLVVGHPNPQAVDFGAEFVPGWDEACELLREHPFKVVVLPAFYEPTMIAPTDQPHLVLMAGDVPFERLAAWVNTGRVVAVVNDLSPEPLAQAVQAALAVLAEERQQEDLVHIAHEQNRRLKALQTDLESQVTTREAYLRKAKERLATANRRYQLLHQALVAVHQSNSLGDLEASLTAALRGDLDIVWTRLVFHSVGLATATGALEEAFATFTVPLYLATPLPASLQFGRRAGREFRREERDILLQIAEVVAMAVDRFNKLDEAEHLKKQWEATFDAITEPICLTDEQLRIVRLNRSFLEKCGGRATPLFGEPAFSTFFGRAVDWTVDPAADELSFEMMHQRDGRDFLTHVTCQRVDSIARGESRMTNWVVIFHDVTEKRALQLRIRESAKLAELGTIGSSIAHELNNPLAGLLSFAQLLQMEKEENQKIMPELQEIEAAAQRCKEIIENLLGFSRQSSPDSRGQVDLAEVLGQAIKITELQTRPQGTVIQATGLVPPMPIHGSFQVLAQAFCQLLQPVLGRGRANFEVRVTTEPTDYTIAFPGHSEVHHGFSLSLARRMIEESGGRIEFFSQPNSGNSVKVTIPRLDLPAVNLTVPKVRS